MKTTPIPPEVAAQIMASTRWRVLPPNENGCHLWHGVRNDVGYPQVSWHQRTLYAHRVSLVARLGRDLALEMTVDHLCRTPACVNADHLEEVTNSVNILRRQTHCIWGHELGGDNVINTHIGTVRRGCLACRRERRALIKRAARSLGLSEPKYTAAYGWSRAAAQAVLDGCPLYHPRPNPKKKEKHHVNA